MPRDLLEDLALGLELELLAMFLLPFSLLLAAGAKGKLFPTQGFQSLPEGPSHPPFFVVAVVLHAPRLLSRHQFN